MRIPEITSLQFLALSTLVDGECSGRSLRQRLADHDYRKSAPAFYQFMARLEEAGLVVGRYELKKVAGQVVKERVYEISKAGVLAFEEFRDFALSRGGVRLQGA